MAGLFSTINSLKFFLVANLLNSVTRDLREITARKAAMLRGYFEDCYLNLVSSSRLMKEGAKMAYVVGNARYSGLPIYVDEILSDIGQQIGLNLERIIAFRYRGNSAQQMGEYGREPSRESVVVFKR